MISTSQANAAKTSQLHVLTEVTKTLITPLELSDLLEAVMDTIANVLERADFGVVWLWDASTGFISPQVVRGPDFPHLQDLRQIKLREGESAAGKVFRDGKAVVFGTPTDVASAMADLQPANNALWHQGLDSTQRPFSMIAVPLWAGGQKYGVLMLGTLNSSHTFAADDIPFIQILADLIALAIERARLETEARVVSEAKQADRLRAEALAVLSHELRTPLGAIKGYCTALLMPEPAWPQQKQHEFLLRIDEECNYLESMIGELLDSSLNDAGRFTLEYHPVRVQRLAQEVADEMQHLNTNHSFVLNFPAIFPLIDADPFRIKQILRNLVTNAMKYSPSGGQVIIAGEVRATDIVVSIADQGIGIAAEDLMSLFDKYFRVKTPSEYQIPGAGLGLPTARAIVEAHGGKIWAESKVGQGTTFFFTLPRQEWNSNEELSHE
jgi:K+-sensing histidine kinase KdpD